MREGGKKGEKFEKFRDNAKRRLHSRKKRQKVRMLQVMNTPHLNRNSHAQTFTKKIVRSIKRRQLRNILNALDRRNSFRLSLTNSSLKKANKRTATMPTTTTTTAAATTSKHDTSIEEGEIISDDESNNRQVNVSRKTPAKSSSAQNASDKDDDDNDDDCICIEPTIEQIVIDDDQPTPLPHSKHTNNLSSGYVSLTQRMNLHASRKLVTSTPLCAHSNKEGVETAANSTNNGKDFGDGLTIFYEDVSCGNMFDKTKNSAEPPLYNPLISGCFARRYAKGGSKSKGKQKKFKGKKHAIKSSKFKIDNDIIILDDTDLTIKPIDVVKREAQQQIDDSVIFISETVGSSNKPAPMTDFVPLCSNDVPNPIHVPKSPPRPVRQAAIDSGLFTRREKKELVAYNNNAYNPDANNPEAPNMQLRKRLIIIDGCNVAFNHALNREFSVKGLQICIDYFERMGHEVKAVVPQFRMHRCSDSNAMFELHKAGKLVVTPCKNLPGKFSSSYDDRFVLQLASEMDAAIVSNDNYRDLINENAAFKKLIENRVIGFTWCNDLFMVAKDPYGRWGPPLQVILNGI